MPRKIVDFSAKSKIIRQEPFGLHFWECSPEEFVDYLRNPREFLQSMGIILPADCRIETTVENHDWLSIHTNGLRAAQGIIVCNVGGGNVGVTRNIYRVISFAHTHDDIGKFQKTLLHGEDEEERT
jgi:hypothetical protein